MRREPGSKLPAEVEFTRRQKSYWRDVDEAHFRWQTEGAYIAKTEAELVACASPRAGERMLEIGCGEGANLLHLRRQQSGANLFAVDFSLSKARFAAAISAARTAAADAANLPFRERTFDSVLIRDLLHHVHHRGAVVAEALRVLRAGGSLTIIEPNGRNPIVAAMALAIGAERGMLRSTLHRVTSELREAGARVVETSHDQPLPIARVVLHYRFGAPRLGSNPTVAALLRGAERAATVLPRALWAYFTVRAIAP